MRDYPSISGSNGQDFQEFDAHVFDKLDGSNLRAELNLKKGFYKFGTRTRLFDKTDPVFGRGVDLFKTLWEEKFLKLTKDYKWDSVVIFCEFWGPKSFAGRHDPADTHTLTLFDIAPHRHGIIGPKEFLKITDGWAGCPAYYGMKRWTRGFVKEVRDGKFGCTFEGVVGKAGERHNIIRAKAKTQAWIDKVIATHNPDEATKIIES